MNTKVIRVFLRGVHRTKHKIEAKIVSRETMPLLSKLKNIFE